MLGEKENYKYLGILEEDTIRQIEMKGKIRKDYHRRIRKLHETKLSNSAKEKKQQLSRPPRKIFGAILKKSKGGIKTNGSKDTMIDDDAQSLTCWRWHRYLVNVILVS